jgi:hypothetical protein
MWRESYERYGGGTTEGDPSGRFIDTWFMRYRGRGCCKIPSTLIEQEEVIFNFEDR